jgi:glutamate synthase domain-containing protein 1
MGSSASQKPESDGESERSSGKGVTSLKTQQRECARLHVAGWSTKRIATELGYQVATIRAWKRQPIVKDYIRVLEAVRERGALAEFERLQRDYLPEAVDTVVDVMRKDDARDADRLNAAQDIMDRSGLPKVSRQQVARLTAPLIQIHLSPERERAIQQVLEGPKEEINDVEWSIVKDEDT